MTNGMKLLIITTMLLNGCKDDTCKDWRHNREIRALDRVEVLDTKESYFYAGKTGVVIETSWRTYENIHKEYCAGPAYLVHLDDAGTGVLGVVSFFESQLKVIRE